MENQSVVVDEIFKQLGLKHDITKRFLVILIRAVILFDKKQNDYGTGNIGKFGELGCLIRASDKIERLMQLVYLKREQAVEDEKISDTWIDLGNYAYIALMCREGAWDKDGEKI